MSQKVLVVDDQKSIADAIARLLSRFDLSSDTAGDGIEALRKFSQKKYDLIIMDLALPRMTGAEAIRKIRSEPHGRDVPIIIITGVYKGEKYAEKAREAFGVKYYMEKPFTQEAFVKAITDSLAGEPEVKVEKVEQKKAPANVTERAPVAVRRVKDDVGAQAAAPPHPQGGHQQLASIHPTKAVRGDLSQVDMGSLLNEIRQKRTSGLLFVKRDCEERTVLLSNGVPVSMKTDNTDSSFGNHLFCSGRISLMEYQVYQGMAVSPSFSDEIFIKMGSLYPDEFRTEWTSWMEESLIRMFEWGSGDFTIQMNPKLPEGSPVPSTNISHIIHQGYRRYLPAERAEELRAKHMERFLFLLPAYYDHQMHLDIGPEEAVFLDSIDGSMRLADLLPDDTEEALKLLRALASFIILGMVETRTKPGNGMIEAPYPIRDRTIERTVVKEEEPEEATGPAPEEQAPAEAESAVGFDDLMDELEDSLGDISEAPPEETAAAEESGPSGQAEKEAALKEFYEGAKKKSYYELFGLSSDDFSITKCREEYFRLTKEFSPENFIMSSGEYLSIAEETLSMLATAYNTLSNVVSKEKYDEMLSTHSRASGAPGARDHEKMQAEVAFQSGMAFLEMADWDGAEKSLAEAMNYAPDNADIIANYAYAVYNKNRRSKTIQKRVHDMLNQALRLKPKCAPAYGYRAALFLDEDKVSLAEGDFKKALSINPRYRFAVKGLRKIEARKQEEKKGIFGRFKK